MVPESRISADEVAWIKGTFKDNDVALKTLRKYFLWEIESDTPMGMAKDMWTSLDLKGMSHEERLQLVIARQMLINHLEGSLMALKIFANSQDESPEVTMQKLKKDSTK